MEQRLSYLDLPITQRSVGGVRFDATLGEVRSLLGEPISARPGKDPRDQLSIWEYRGITVLTKAEKVEGLIAEHPYQGHFESAGMYVGMPWRELKEVQPRITFDGDLLTWVIPDLPTVEVEIARPLKAGHGPGASNPQSEAYEVMFPYEAWVESIAVREVATFSWLPIFPEQPGNPFF